MPFDNNSIFGPLRPVLLPQDFDIHNIGRALLAWDYHLTAEQVQLLEMIVSGLKNSAIADELDVSQDQTANSRIQELYRRLGVNSRSLACGIAARYGVFVQKK